MAVFKRLGKVCQKLMMRSKRRYLAILFDLERSQTEIKRDIEDRFMQLFGTIAVEDAFLRSYQSKKNGILILGCDLEYLEKVLFTIAVVCKPMTTLSLSGTLRRLRRRLDSIQLDSPNP